MHYELFVRKSDLQSERIVQALIERKRAFVEIQLAEHEAAELEERTGRSLPLVMRGAKVIGGYSDLANSLRARPSQASRLVRAC